jgi:hypothetical protein
LRTGIEKEKDEEAFETPTRMVYVCGDFVGNYSYDRNSYQPVLQSVGILHEELPDVTFERNLSILSIGNHPEGRPSEFKVFIIR